MINSNIDRRVLVEVIDDTTALLNGEKLYILYRRGERAKKPGRRYLYLKFSVFNDKYFLGL
jgi:hypothetical protein